MQKRKFDELVSYFNKKVSEMEIETKYKMELLGMVTALGYAHEKEMSDLSETKRDSSDLISRQAVSMKNRVMIDEFIKPTGGCIKCAKCTHVRTSSFCGNKKLTNKQLYNEKGYCSEFVPKCGAKMERGEQ